MALLETENDSVLVVINRALSIRPKLDFGYIQSNIKTALSQQNEAQARLFQSLLGDVKADGCATLCVDLISNQPSWKTLCAELLRYSEANEANINIVLKVIAKKQPTHPAIKIIKKKQAVYAAAAFDARDDGDYIYLNIDRPPPEHFERTGFFMSIENPIDLYSSCKVTGQSASQLKLIPQRETSLFDEGTVIAKPSIFFLIA